MISWWWCGCCSWHGRKSCCQNGRNDGQKSWRFWCKSFWKLFLIIMGWIQEHKKIFLHCYFKNKPKTKILILFNKNPNFWSAILSTKKEEKEDTTTYYYNVFNVGSQLCLFVRLFDSNIQFKISLMISSTSSTVIITRSWILTIHKARILRKKGPWKNVFGHQKVGKNYTNRGL